MVLIKRLRTIWQRTREQRSYYARGRDWLLGIYNRILIHLPHAPMPGRGKLLLINLCDQALPVTVRLNTTDWYAMEEVFITGEYKTVADSVGIASTVLDLGVNVGMSIRFWQTLWPEAKIVGVEPDKGNIHVAKKNLLNTDGPAPVLIQACVAGTARKVHLDRHKGEYGFMMADGASGGEAIDALTLSQICHQTGLDGEIDLLKCDIEGAEAELFANCAPWIGRIRNMVIELHEPYTLSKFEADLARAGVNPEKIQVESKGSQLVVFLRLCPGTIREKSAASTAGAEGTNA